MIINGLQKLTLLDFPGKTACTVFLAGCDYKCPFCHNSELISANAPAVMDDTELLKFLNTRKGLLDGVAFTGGEPTLRKELPQLMEKIKAMGFGVKLDTNGNHPKALQYMLESGLVDYVAMDIKNSPERYPETIGLEKADMQNIYDSISMLINGKTDYEFRTTVMAQLHDENSFKSIGPMIKGARRYYLQPFEDQDSVVFAGFTAPDREKLESYAALMQPYAEKVEIRGI